MTLVLLSAIIPPNLPCLELAQECLDDCGACGCFVAAVQASAIAGLQLTAPRCTVPTESQWHTRGLSARPCFVQLKSHPVCSSRHLIVGQQCVTLGSWNQLQQLLQEKIKIPANSD